MPLVFVARRYRAESRRQIALLGGVLACWVALGSPLSGSVHELLSAHMLQHLLLSTVAAPLLWLGAPELPERRWTGAVDRVLGHSIATWSAPVVVLFAWHVPPMFDLALNSPVCHAVEQVSFPRERSAVLVADRRIGREIARITAAAVSGPRHAPVRRAVGIPRVLGWLGVQRLPLDPSSRRRHCFAGVLD